MSGECRALRVTPDQAREREREREGERERERDREGKRPKQSDQHPNPTTPQFTQSNIIKINQTMEHGVK